MNKKTYKITIRNQLKLASCLQVVVNSLVVHLTIHTSFGNKRCRAHVHVLRKTVSAYMLIEEDKIQGAKRKRRIRRMERRGGPRKNLQKNWGADHTTLARPGLFQQMGHWRKLLWEKTKTKLNLFVQIIHSCQLLTLTRFHVTSCAHFSRAVHHIPCDTCNLHELWHNTHTSFPYILSLFFTMHIICCAVRWCNQQGQIKKNLLSLSWWLGLKKTVDCKMEIANLSANT